MCLQLLRGILRHEKRRLDFIPEDHLPKYRPKVRVYPRFMSLCLFLTHTHTLSLSLSLSFFLSLVHSTQVIADMAHLQWEMVQAGMLAAVVDAFRFDNVHVQRVCYEFLIDLFENSNKKIQVLFHRHVRGPASDTVD